jgi:acyl carrier protein
MGPSIVAVLDRFPTDPNGKVDRAALSAARVEPSVPPVAASDDADLCDLVQRILGVEFVLPEDNFFDLGGHSVLATMLARQIRKNFDVVIPMRTIFEAATLADLADVVHAARQPGARG